MAIKIYRMEFSSTPSKNNNREYNKEEYSNEFQKYLDCARLKFIYKKLEKIYSITDTVTSKQISETIKVMNPVNIRKFFRKIGITGETSKGYEMSNIKQRLKDLEKEIEER